MTIPKRTQGSATRPLLITLIVVIVIAALGFIYASPYLAVNNLKRAADARDAQTVNQYVDFPALRDSLKQQVGAMLTRRLEADAGNKMATIGAVIGVTLIGPLVDAYATPDGVAALLNGMPPRGTPGEQPSAPPAAGGGAPAAGDTTTQASAPPPGRQSTAGYRSLNEFVVTYRRGEGNANYSAIFRREGLVTWKLAAINLNE
ncbi:DUF2939 domain-containing protein [Paraburkholderia sp. CNPSo 3155]|uniref:DUF2939 domain-containing protein n=1 Tax=Paraburkholderia atlantica TaxID=2654982 RepID=UPI00128BCADC|nr:DUF2939 domain-containing protein [Paraburkholderia atlantica]MPW06167.1 DUF2939 domain-containing protein [Paraburkholderia atlantica]NUY34859.1 DUF2939 domain-containing protein [Paraburkholderia atlantica]